MRHNPHRVGIDLKDTPTMPSSVLYLRFMAVEILGIMKNKRQPIVLPELAGEICRYRKFSKKNTVQFKKSSDLSENMVYRFVDELNQRSLSILFLQRLS